MINKHFKIGLFNAGSLGTRHEEFIVAMDRLAVDMMAINETWLRTGQEGKAPIVPGYRLKHTPRPVSVKGGLGGGVGFYIKQGIYVRTCPHPHSESIEQIWLHVKVNTQKIIVGTAYRPSWVNITTFLDCLTQSVASFSGYDGLAILGDFNINLLESDNKSKLIQSFFNQFNLKQLVSEPTHFTDHSQTLIDLVCTDVRALSTNVYHIPDLGNHAMISVELNIKALKPIPQHITYRPLKDIILELFNCDLNMINYIENENVNNVNDLVSLLNMFIVNLFDLHAPKKSILIKKPSYPWLTDTIKEMMDIRNHYHDQYKSSKTDIHKQSYLDMKHIVINAIYQEKKIYFDSHINNNIHNPKKLWKNLKSNIIPNTKSFQLPSFCKSPDDINSHFLNVPGSEYRKNQKP